MYNGHTRELILAVIAVLAVALVAVAAAPVFSQEPGGGRQPVIEQSTPTEPVDQQEVESPIPFRPLLIGILVLVAIAVISQFASDPLGTLKAALGMVFIIGSVLILVQYIPTSTPSSPERDQQSGIPNETTPIPNETTGFGEGVNDSFAAPIDNLTAIIFIAVVSGVVVLLVFRSDAVRSALGMTKDSDKDSSDVDLAAVGRAAGDAADRVQKASSPQAADNAVYNAWGEMVALLDAPDPQSGTPRQFAVAALEAGMDPDDVTLLTRAFEEVRYGDTSLSAEDYDRVTAALRRIEATYINEDGKSPASPSTSGGEHDLGLDGDKRFGGAE